jgi:hypothetical protein
MASGPQAPCLEWRTGVAESKGRDDQAEITEERGILMQKFLVLYKAPASSFEQMMKATPEQQKAGMDAWMAWSKKAAATIVDMGGPLKGGASPTTNDLGGYSILQAESKEALAESLKGHPHFMTPDGTIEIVELMPMPGM